MGKEITINQLATLSVLTDEQLLDIIKRRYLKKIIYVEKFGERDAVQIIYGNGGWLFKEYETKQWTEQNTPLTYLN